MANVKDLEPYAANLEGLIAVLEDFRKTMPIAVPSKVVGYQAEAFENVSQGDAIYSRTSDGKVGKAVANGTLDQATVAGFAETTKTAGQTVRVIVSGQVAAGTQTLDAGDIFFLSASSAGSITKNPPTAAGQFLTLVGEAPNTSELIVRIKRPIQLR
tara:strand:+ start:202 stop:672 length:471 start_codon:yes stop_codon:yes gene_type:complete